MDFPELDDEGYPTEETLEVLRKWPIPEWEAALDFIAAAWYWPDLVSRDVSAEEFVVLHGEPHDKFLRCVTGGWSGNEDLIGAFQEHFIGWSMTWRLSSCGGLHIFKYPKCSAGSSERKD